MTITFEPQQYTFSSSDDNEKTFTRKLHGFEALCNSYALHDFLLAYTGSVEVQLQADTGFPMPEAKMKECLRGAWILLRKQVPAVALRTTYNAEDTSWMCIYDVPQSFSEVEAWTEQTLLWRETEKGYLEHDLDIGDLKWEFTHGEFPLKLIASPVNVPAGRYLLSLAGPHGMVDGRMSAILLDQLVVFLDGQLSRTEPVNVSQIRWGSEAQRLAPTGAVLAGSENADLAPTTVEEECIPFLPPFIENKTRTHDVAARLVSFDRARTSAFRRKCREHHTTVTIVMDAVFAVSQVEAVLSCAHAIGGEHYASTLTVFNTASHWFMPLSCKDQRPDWPASSSIHRPEGTTLFGTDGFALETGMDTIRKAIGFSAEGGSLTFKPAERAFFWSDVLKEMAD